MGVPIFTVVRSFRVCSTPSKLEKKNCVRTVKVITIPSPVSDKHCARVLNVCIQIPSREMDARESLAEQGSLPQGTGFFLPGNQPVLGFAFSYLSWVEPVLGGCFSRQAPEGSNRGLLFVIPFLGKNQY